jgi:hypothetical protein
MFYDVKHFLNHDYLVKDGKIGYKEMGQIYFQRVMVIKQYLHIIIILKYQKKDKKYLKKI